MQKSWEEEKEEKKKAKGDGKEVEWWWGNDWDYTKGRWLRIWNLIQQILEEMIWTLLLS